MSEIDLKQGDNGHDEESQEELQTAYKTLSELSAGGTSMVQFSKQDLSLMKQILSTGSEEYREQTMWRMCDFLDEDEALDHVAAYYEAKDLGMDTTFNVAYMFALTSANRKTGNTSLIAKLLGVFDFSNKGGNQKRGNRGDYNSRSPLDNPG